MSHCGGHLVNIFAVNTSSTFLTIKKDEILHTDGVIKSKTYLGGFVGFVEPIIEF